MSAADDDLSQINGIMKTYVDSARAGNSAVMRPVFHELATICGYVGPNLFVGPMQLFFDWHDDNGPAAGIKVLDTHIDIEGTAASVRIDLDDWTGIRFTDFFTLVKIDEEWKILSKVFHLHLE